MDDINNIWLGDDSEFSTTSVAADSDTKPENHIARYAGKPVRVTLRMPAEQKDRLHYWSEVKGLSANEYVMRAIDNQIARDNGHFDGETIISHRLAELTDAVNSGRIAQENFAHQLSQVMRTLMAFTVGDTNLLDVDDDDGVL